MLLGPIRAVTYIFMHGLPAVCLGALWHWRAHWGITLVTGSIIRLLGTLGYLGVTSWTLNEDLFSLLLANVYSLLVIMPFCLVHLMLCTIRNVMCLSCSDWTCFFAAGLLASADDLWVLQLCFSASSMECAMLSANAFMLLLPNSVHAVAICAVLMSVSVLAMPCLHCQCLSVLLTGQDCWRIWDSISTGCGCCHCLSVGFQLYTACMCHACCVHSFAARHGLYTYSAPKVCSENYHEAARPTCPAIEISTKHAAACSHMTHHAGLQTKASRHTDSVNIGDDA